MKIKLLTFATQCIAIGFISSANAAPSIGGGNGGGIEIVTDACTEVSCATLCPQGLNTSDCQAYDSNNVACFGNISTACYQDKKNSSLKYIVQSCTGCSSGYKLVEREISVCPGALAGTGPKHKICAKICDQGYYANDAGTCSRCPSSGGIYGTTDGSGATSVSQCYIPANTQLSDSAGKYIYTSKCFYTE